MNLKSILGKISIAALAVIAIQGCKKENGIDNNNVIVKPFALYASDNIGNIVKSNDGTRFSTMFPGDGQKIRAIVLAAENVVVIKHDQAFYSKDDGLHFTDVKVTNYRVTTDIPWSSFIRYVPQHNRVMSANEISVGGQCSYSPSKGESYMPDTNYVKGADKPNALQSFAQLDNGLLFGFSPLGSTLGSTSLYSRESIDEPWKPVSYNLPMPYKWQITNFGNTLVAYDFEGVESAYYSVDSGKHFNKYPGLPTAKSLICAYGGFETLLIGTPVGIYKYSAGSFQASNSGLDANTIVYGIVGKENVFKNDGKKRFIFIATSTGLYRSEDLGKSWIKVRPGIFTAIG